MSGIYVGIDGSSHSQIALVWAMREAGYRQQPGLDPEREWPTFPGSRYAWPAWPTRCPCWHDRRDMSR